jgi:hypothetical protein
VTARARRDLARAVDLVRVDILPEKRLQLLEELLAALVPVGRRQRVGVDQIPGKLAHEERTGKGRVLPVALAAFLGKLQRLALALGHPGGVDHLVVIFHDCLA